MLYYLRIIGSSCQVYALNYAFAKVYLFLLHQIVFLLYQAHALACIHRIMADSFLCLV